MTIAKVRCTRFIARAADPSGLLCASLTVKRSMLVLGFLQVPAPLGLSNIFRIPLASLLLSAPRLRLDYPRHLLRPYFQQKYIQCRPLILLWDHPGRELSTHSWLAV